MHPTTKTVAIYNIFSNLVFSKEVGKEEKELEVDMGNFNAGYYFVVFKDAGKRQIAKMFVKV